MEIVWYGQTCFRLSEQGMATVVTDPYPPEVGLSFPRAPVDVVTTSLDDPACAYMEGLEEPRKLFSGPGEYEIGGVFITGIATLTSEGPGSDQRQNTIFTFDYDGRVICHLGHLSQVPTQSQVEDLGAVDVLLTPVGGRGSLSPSQASEVISLFEPAIVVPMLYDIPGLQMELGTLSRFLKEMAAEEGRAEKTLKVSRSSLHEGTRVAVLEPRCETTR